LNSNPANLQEAGCCDGRETAIITVTTVLGVGLCCVCALALALFAKTNPGKVAAARGAASRFTFQKKGAKEVTAGGAKTGASGRDETRSCDGSLVNSNRKRAKNGHRFGAFGRLKRLGSNSGSPRPRREGPDVPDSPAIELDETLGSRL